MNYLITAIILTLFYMMALNFIVCCLAMSGIKMKDTINKTWL